MRADAIIFTETLVHGNATMAAKRATPDRLFTNSLLTVQVGQPTILILLTSHNMQTSPIGNLHCSSPLTPDIWGENQDRRSERNPTRSPKTSDYALSADSYRVVALLSASFTRITRCRSKATVPRGPNAQSI